MARFRLLIILFLISFMFSCSYNLKVSFNPDKPVIKNDIFMQNLIISSLEKAHVIDKINSDSVQFPQSSEEKNYIFLRNTIINYLNGKNIKIFETKNRNLPTISISIMELYVSYKAISKNYFNQFDYFKRCGNLFFYFQIKDHDESIDNIIKVQDASCDTLAKESLDYIKTEIPEIRSNIKDRSFLKETILSSIFILLSIYLFYTDKET